MVDDLIAKLNARAWRASEANREEPLPDKLGHWLEHTQTTEQLHHLFDQTKNDLYAWEALSRGNRGDPIPDWCEPCMRDAALTITQLALGHHSDAGEISAEQALKLVPQALGLGKQGQNQFAALQNDRDQLTDAAMSTSEFSSLAKFLRKLGLQAIANKYDVTKTRALQRLARGKRIMPPG